MPSFQVGDQFTATRDCDKYRPIYYGAVSGDFNPIHIDPEVGRMAGLGGAILQGMCTMAWAAEAVVGYLGDPGRLSKLRVRFSRPVAIDDTITFRGKVTRVEGRLLAGELSATNQKGEEVLRGAVFEARLD